MNERMLMDIFKKHAKATTSLVEGIDYIGEFSDKINTTYRATKQYDSDFTVKDKFLTYDKTLAKFFIIKTIAFLFSYFVVEQIVDAVLINGDVPPLVYIAISIWISRKTPAILEDIGLCLK